MIMDRQTMLSVAQAITTGTVVSTNSYDLGVARDLGPADVELACEIVQAFAGGTSLQVNLITSAAADLSAPVIVLSSPAYVLANLTLGREIFRVELPSLTLDAELLRYIGLQYVAAGTFTGGALTSGLVLDRHANRAYASGLNMGGF